MQANLQRQCDQLIENYNRILPGNHFEYDWLLVAGAAMFLANGAEVDPECLRECGRLLRKRKGIFSSFRGTAEFIVRCKMAMADNPEEYLAQLDSVYRELKTVFSTGQVLLAAMVIVDLSPLQEQDAVIRRTRDIYQEMRKAHPWLTSEDDMPFSALMAVTGRDCTSIYEEAEKCYGILKQEFSATAETRQMLSHILSIYPGFAESKCEKVRILDEGLRKAKHPLGKDRYLSILGTLAGTSLPAEELVRIIGEADDYLKTRKPFKGVFGVGANVRRMMAVQMTGATLQERGYRTGSVDNLAVSSLISTSIEVTVITLILMYIVIASASSSSASHS